jgi:hypothetical protein
MTDLRGSIPTPRSARQRLGSNRQHPGLDYSFHVSKSQIQSSLAKTANKLRFPGDLIWRKGRAGRWLQSQKDGRRQMFKNILIATDGSDLAEHAVTNGLSLAKSVGAKVSVIIVEAPFMFNVPESRVMQDAFAQ